MADLQGRRVPEEISVYEKERLRLVIADSHQLFRDCLADVLAADQDLKVVGTFASAQQAFPGLGESEARVLLLGFESLDDAAPLLVREVCARHPELKVILLGREETDDSVLACLEAGASGYVMRDQPLADLRSAIGVVAHGEIACTPRIAHALFQRLASLGRKRR